MPDPDRVSPFYKNYAVNKNNVFVRIFRNFAILLTDVV
jgi:hypothetical protein